MPRLEALPDFADLVRSADRPRYFAALFAPKGVRSHLLAVAALRCELASVADRVSEAGVGEIRLQWWHDALRTIAEGGDAETPLLRALEGAIDRRGLSGAPLLAMADAYRRDLYSDPPPSTNDLEGFFGETESAVFQLSALILGANAGATAEAAGHAGVAYGLARRLSAVGAEHARGRVIVPSDILARHGLAPAKVFDGSEPDRMMAAIGHLAAFAREHHRRALALVAPLHHLVRPAFLPLVAVPPLIAAVEKAGSAVLRRNIRTSDAALLLRMAGRAMF